ncbi:hypothetical protein [Lysinibacillus sp. D3C2_S12]|uniref:hypothetical protein n=1 Tax=Lysinibacillus sp. D3C2_S12 TaxID=2941226 RepID=UPI0020BFAEC5|nr:hypothetical protein [Lysinibacillus sp. D3C2_S12]
MDLTSIVLFFVLMILAWVSFSLFVIEEIMSFVAREKHNVAVASHLGGTGLNVVREDKEPE